MALRVFVIVVRNVAVVKSKERVEAAISGSVLLREETKMPLADQLRSISQIVKILREYFNVERKTPGLATHYTFALHTWMNL